MKKTLLLLALAATLCIPADAAKPKKTKDITATAAEVKGVWKVGEEISFFNSYSNAGSIYTTKSLGFTTVLQGKGSVTNDDGFRCAVYPASCIRMWTPANAHIIIPREQTARLNGYPEDGVLMSACTTGREMVFEPVMGYIKFVIDKDSPATIGVMVKANKFIAGTYKIRMNDPQMKVELDSGTPRWHEVLLKSADGSQLAPGTYYVGLFARIFPDGLTIERFAPDGTSSEIPLSGKIVVNKGQAFSVGALRTDSVAVAK